MLLEFIIIVVILYTYIWCHAVTDRCLWHLDVMLLMSFIHKVDIVEMCLRRSDTHRLTGENTKFSQSAYRYRCETYIDWCLSYTDIFMYQKSFKVFIEVLKLCSNGRRYGVGKKSMICCMISCHTVDRYQRDWDMAMDVISVCEFHHIHSCVAFIYRDVLLLTNNRQGVEWKQLHRW